MLKDRLSKTSSWQFHEWLFGPETFSGLSRNGQDCSRNNGNFSLADGNEGETESSEGEVSQANSQSAYPNNVPRQAENANFANAVNLDLHTSVIDVDVVHQGSNEANQTTSPRGSQDSTKRAQSTLDRFRNLTPGLDLA